jgi:lysophospholipase L1-like esterase
MASTKDSAMNEFILKKNDCVVFLGDSITEQQLYSNYVETYLALRYPELNLSFFNAGWGGDTVPGGLARLERDVLALKPTVVTICYGMNDGAYCPASEEIRRDHCTFKTTRGWHAPDKCEVGSFALFC